MAPNSPVFLDIDDFPTTTTTTNRRHRSNEDLDFLKEEDRWRRHDQARQMVRYRDKNHFGATTTPRDRDRLAVPVYEVSPRRPRARSDTRPSPHDLDNLQRDFKTLEVRPSPHLYNDADDDREPVLLSAHQRGSTQSRDPASSSPNPNDGKRPKIKIPPVIVQEHPPAGQPGKSPSRSPSGQPQLQVKYLTLQNKLTDITLSCIRYIEVEPSNPRDLTFDKISEQIRGFAFELRVWHHVSNIDDMPRNRVLEDVRSVVDACGRNLERLCERAGELWGVLGDAEPGDLKFKERERGEAGNGDGEDIFGDGDDESGNEENDDDGMESKGFVITSCLHSIKLQIQNLKRLSRSLQEATPGAREEMVAVSSLVGDVDRYFGTDEAVHRNGVDKKFSGRRALQEARWAAGG